MQIYDIDERQFKEIEYFDSSNDREVEKIIKASHGFAGYNEEDRCHYMTTEEYIFWDWYFYSKQEASKLAGE